MGRVAEGDGDLQPGVVRGREGTGRMGRGYGKRGDSGARLCTRARPKAVEGVGFGLKSRSLRIPRDKHRAEEHGPRAEILALPLAGGVVVCKLTDFSQPQFPPP